jgi:hypothetical protein
MKLKFKGAIVAAVLSLVAPSFAADAEGGGPCTCTVACAETGTGCYRSCPQGGCSCYCDETGVAECDCA